MTDTLDKETKRRKRYSSCPPEWKIPTGQNWTGRKKKASQNSTTSHPQITTSAPKTNQNSSARSGATWRNLAAEADRARTGALNWNRVELQFSPSWGSAVGWREQRRVGGAKEWKLGRISPLPLARCRHHFGTQYAENFQGRGEGRVLRGGKGVGEPAGVGRFEGGDYKAERYSSNAIGHGHLFPLPLERYIFGSSFLLF